MKKMMSMLAICALTLGAVASNVPEPSGHLNRGDNPTYCTKERDGKTVVTVNGAELTAETTLPNGTRLKPDGTLVNKDGSETVLKHGECINASGKIIKSSKEGMNPDDKKKDGMEEEDRPDTREDNKMEPY